MKKYRIGAITESMAATNFYSQTPKDKAMMNLPFALHLRGEMDVKRMENSIAKVIQQSMFHTYLSFEDGKFFMLDKDAAPFSLESETVEGASEEEKVAKVTKIIEKLALIPLPLFEKDKDQYFFRLYEISETYHILCMIVHHTFLDFGSVMTAVNEIFAAYRDADYKLPASEDYSKFSQDELDFWNTEEGAKEDSYWNKQLEGFKSFSLTTETLAEGEEEISENQCVAVIDRADLDKMAKENRTSVANIAMLIIHMALAKTDDRNDTLVQYAISNRSDMEYRYSLGCLTRILCNRVAFDDSMMVTDLHKLMRKKIGEGYQNRRVAGKTPLGSVPYVVANEDMGDIQDTPMFGGNPVQLDFVDLPRKLNFIGMLIIPLGPDKIGIGLLTDMKAYGKHALAITKNILLAEQVLKKYPDKTFGDYMRSDITLETVDKLADADGAEFIEI